MPVDNFYERQTIGPKERPAWLDEEAAELAQPEAMLAPYPAIG